MPSRRPGRRETASLNLRNPSLLRWLIRIFDETPFGPAPTPPSFELKTRGGDLVAGSSEFEDGKRFFRHFHGALREGDFEGMRILDVGCGYGGRTIYYAEVCNAASPHGIEINAPTVERCRELAQRFGSSKTSFSVGFAEEIPFDDESVDAVVSFDVLVASGIAQGLLAWQSRRSLLELTQNIAVRSVKQGHDAPSHMNMEREPFRW